MTIKNFWTSAPFGIFFLSGHRATIRVITTCIYLGRYVMGILLLFRFLSLRNIQQSIAFVSAYISSNTFLKISYPIKMFCRTFFFVFLLFTFMFFSCTTKKQSLLIKKYPPSDLKSDAELFKNVVLAMHPVIDIYKPRTYYETLFSEFVLSLKDSLTEKQFRLKLKEVVDELHCGHSEVIPSHAYYKEVKKLKLNYSPLVFLPLKNRVYVTANLNKKQDSTIKKGVELTKINGIPVDSALRQCWRYVSSDGYNTTAKEHYIRLAFNTYFPALFGRPDTFSIEYKDGKMLNTKRYKAIQLKNLPPMPLGPKDDSLFTKYKRARMKYRFLDNERKTMLLALEKFSHRKAGKAYRKLFRKLKNNKSQNLIIDLRGNGGGSLGNTYRLLSYLVNEPLAQTLKTGIKKYPYKKHTSGQMWFRFTKYVYNIIGRRKVMNDTDNFIYTIKPRKRNHFNGKIYVMINGGSFSASCLVSAYLKYNSRAVFIGEETGGAIEGCNAGITPYYRLPATGLRVRVPAFRIVHNVNPTITGHGIQPDYEINYSIWDILNRKDLELDKVKQLIKID